MVKTLSLIDTHCHLQDRRFSNDLQDVIKRAEEKGVRKIIVPGWDLISSRDAGELAESFQGVFATAGFHPHDSKDFDEEALMELLNTGRFIGIGEIGLDYFRDLSPRDVQRDVFRRQLKIAEEKKLPVIIHTREAMADAIDIVREFQVKGVFHAFSGDIKDAEKLVEMGFYIGVGGVLTFRNARKLPEVVKNIPVNTLLLETDSPYITPHPHRGKRNEPAYIIYVFNKLCEILNISSEELAEILLENTKDLFGI